MKFLLLFALGVLFVTGEPQRFDGYKVYRVTPVIQQQIDLLLRLESEYNGLDFWSGTNPSKRPVDIMVGPRDQRSFLSLMNTTGMFVQILIEDVQANMAGQPVSHGLGTKMTWTQYYRVDEIHKWMDSLAVEYPGVVSVISGGTSYQDRDIKGVKISFGSGRRGVFIEGGIHAREWISPATTNYLINELLTSTDPTFRKIAETFDWHIFPSTNPDGYEHTHTSNRMWRKTRTLYSSCFGADPNRNWNFHWGEEGSSNQPCSDIYTGPVAFSEKETAGLSDYIDTLAGTLDVYLSLHSYGQYILIPYGHAEQHADNYDDLYTIATAAAVSLAKRYNTRYTYGNTAEILYKASGASDDYVKSKYNISIVYTIEMRDTGRNGFLLPAAEIIPNCLEIMDGIVAIFEEGEKLGYFELSK